MTQLSQLDKGPALFIAQPFSPKRKGWETLEACCKTAGGAGYRGGIQLPLWDGRLIDLDQAAESTTYCDELKGKAEEAGCPITSVANHLNTNLVVVSPAYRAQLSLFAPKELHFASIDQLHNWADAQVRKTVLATRNLGFDRCAAFSGGTLFPYIYKWPAQPNGLVDNAMRHLANRWMPHFDFALKNGVRWAFEEHPGMDLLCGGAMRRFLEKHGKNHAACCKNLDFSHRELMGITEDGMAEEMEQDADRIIMWHIKDAALIPTSAWGVYCFMPWIQCPGQFRSLGDGRINYPRYFKIAREKKIDVIPVVEWECSVKGIDQGITEEGPAYVEACLSGAPLPAKTAARPHSDVFDAFAEGASGARLIAEMLGIPETNVVL